MMTRVCTSDNKLLLVCPLVLLMVMVRGFLMLLLLLLKFVVRGCVSSAATGGCIALNQRSGRLAVVEEGLALVGHFLKYYYSYYFWGIFFFRPVWCFSFFLRDEKNVGC
jgi:hypothetical protein